MNSECVLGFLGLYIILFIMYLLVFCFFNSLIESYSTTLEFIRALVVIYWSFSLYLIVWTHTGQWFCIVTIVICGFIALVFLLSLLRLFQDPDETPLSLRALHFVTTASDSRRAGQQILGVNAAVDPKYENVFGQVQRGYKKAM